MGEIEREAHSYANGVQCSNRWRVPGLIAFAAKPEKQAQTPEDKATKASPHPDSFVGPISPDSLSPKKNTPPPPKPEAEDRAQTKPRKERGGGKEKISPEEEAENARIGAEAVEAYAELAQPTWVLPKEQDRKRPNWLGERVRKLGGLQEWRRILALAATSRWINAQPDFGLSFFASHRTTTAVRDGRWGVKIPKLHPSSGLSPETLAKMPWLSCADHPDRHRLDSAEIERGLDEARSVPIFGRAQEAFAVWRILKPKDYAAWRLLRQ